MVEAKFHLFQIQKKVAASDSIIAPQFCLGECPEALNAVDVIPFSGKFSAAMIDTVMPVAVSEETVIRSERIRINRAALGDFLPDDKAENGARDIGYWTGVDPSIPLEKPKNSDFSGCTSAAVALAVPTEIRLIDFDFTSEGGLPLALPDNNLPDTGVEALGTVTVDAEFTAGAACRHFKGEKADELSHDPV